jgi:hypothetical protein
MIRPQERAVYNSGIAEMSIFPSGCSKRARSLVIVICLCWSSASLAGEWTSPVVELARKIATLTGPGTVAFSLANRSSLSNKDVEDVTGELRAQLESLSVHATQTEQPRVSVQVSLSENPQNHVWVAEVRRGPDSSIVMVSTPRLVISGATRESFSMAIRRTALWTQEKRILDVLVLEESAGPTRLAVLDDDSLGLYRVVNGRWQQEQLLAIPHAKPWPRDLRGRLSRADRGVNAFLPGVTCQLSGNNPAILNCRESNDPWPLSNQITLSATFEPARNFFTGTLTPGIGKQTSIAKFYSAAPLVRQNSTVWVMALTDGTEHVLDGAGEQTLNLNWGSDVAGVRSSCGLGSQVLTTDPGNGRTDAVRAFEMREHDTVPVSAKVDFAGPVTALWTDARGTAAIAVSKNAETQSYEAFRLAVVCGQ